MVGPVSRDERAVPEGCAVGYEAGGFLSGALHPVGRRGTAGARPGSGVPCGSGLWVVGNRFVSPCGRVAMGGVAEGIRYRKISR